MEHNKNTGKKKLHNTKWFHEKIWVANDKHGHLILRKEGEEEKSNRKSQKYKKSLDKNEKGPLRSGTWVKIKWY